MFLEKWNPCKNGTTVVHALVKTLEDIVITCSPMQL